jgi:hypothetical protein
MQHRDRPSLLEAAAILAACAVLLVTLAHLDDSASRQEATRARAVFADQAHAKQLVPRWRQDARRIDPWAAATGAWGGAATHIHIEPDFGVGRAGGGLALAWLFVVGTLGAAMAAAGGVLLVRGTSSRRWA